MGESAAILNPEKKVLMPDMTADCAMAHMVQLEKIREMRETYEDLAVVCYINSTAEIKTYSDVCVTSANAVKIVRNLRIRIFSLFRMEIWEGMWQNRFRSKHIIFNDGYCPIHAAMSAEAVKKGKGKTSGSQISGSS